MTLLAISLAWFAVALAVASLFGRACQMGEWVDCMPADNTTETVCVIKNRSGEHPQ